jgi:hypothetical protein
VGKALQPDTSYQADPSSATSLPRRKKRTIDEQPAQPPQHPSADAHHFDKECLGSDVGR